MENTKKIQRILALKANCDRLEECAACGTKIDSCYYYDKGTEKIGHMLCKECNNMKITVEDIKDNYTLEYLYKRIHKQIKA